MYRPHDPDPHVYPAARTSEPEGGATVVFRDLPEAITCGNDDEDVMAMAREVLELAVAERIGRGEEVPVASAAEPGDLLVRLCPPRCGDRGSGHRAGRTACSERGKLRRLKRS